ncbi:UNKNOWN [Stylonychia lemnae]|uniref:Uncharacterized protein n=1 Tax=Stylonychia lemnae TaxID=5949 RepID=A0A078ABM3_STYLE|nr:UNKNOWN [Stylonychia lemnae]|eukprot:CDW78982.1 UNKNOWN [Stylonychia lemnae]
MSLTKEKIFLYKMQKKQSQKDSQINFIPRIPIMYGDGSLNIQIKSEQGEVLRNIGVSYLVLEYFDSNLTEYFEIQAKSGIQADQVGQSTVCLIDFGAAEEFSQEKFDKIGKFDLIGTPLTASVYAHQQFYTCQGDDLISAFYSLLFLSLDQNLPWYQLCLDYDKAEQKNGILEKIKEQKIKLERDYNLFGLFQNALIRQIKQFEMLRGEQPSKYTTQIDYDLIIEQVKNECLNLSQQENLIIPKAESNSIIQDEQIELQDIENQQCKDNQPIDEHFNNNSQVINLEDEVKPSKFSCSSSQKL